MSADEVRQAPATDERTWPVPNRADHRRRMRELRAIRRRQARYRNQIERPSGDAA